MNCLTNKKMFALSLVIEDEFCRVVLVKSQGKQVSIKFLQEFKNDATGYELLKAEIASITSIEKLPLTVYTGSALPAREIFIRKLSFPFKNKKAIKKALPFQIESLFPLQEKEMTIVPKFFSLEKETDVFLYSFRNLVMEKHLLQLKTFGFDVDWVTSTPSALHSFAEKFFPNSENLILIHFGWKETQYVYLEHGSFCSAQTVDIGYKNFIDALAMGDLPLEERKTGECFLTIFDQALSGSKEFAMLSVEIQNFVQKNQRVLDYLQIGAKGVSEKTSLAFTGYTEVIQALADRNNSFGLKKVLALPHLEFDAEFLSAYAVEIGIALTMVDRGASTIQLNTPRYLSSNKKKQFFKQFYLMGSSFILVFVFLFGGVQVLLGQKKARIKKLFEKVAFSGKKEERYPFLEKKKFSCQEMQSAIYQLRKKHQQKQKEGVFLEVPPQVTQFLAMISSIKEIEQREAVIEEFDYRVKNYPSIEHPEEAFLVDNRIVFSSSYENVLENLMKGFKGQNKGEWKVIKEGLIERKRGLYELEVVFSL